MKLNSKPYIVYNDKYSTIDFDLIFPYKYDKKHIFDIDLITQIVMNTSFDYKTEQEFKIAKIQKLSGINCSNIKLHNSCFLRFSLTCPNPKKIKNFDIESAFELFYRTIYNPNIINEEFNNEKFEREKDYLKFSIQNSLKNVNNYSYQNFLQIFDDIGDMKDNIANNLELIEKANAKDLYDYYKKMVLDNKPICVVYGDIIQDEVEKLYYKYFPKDCAEITFDKDYSCYMKLSKEVNKVEEKADYNQSVLYMGYKVKDMKENDEILLSLLCDILGNRSTNLIQKKLRSEKDLIYTYDFSCYSKKGMFFIATYIDSHNKDKTIEAIDELFLQLRDEKLIGNSINHIIEEFEYNLIETKDSKYYELEKYINNLFEFNISMEKLIDSYKKITAKELISFLDRVQLDTIYFLRGVTNATE